MNITLKNIILQPLNMIYSIKPEIALKILYKLKTGNTLDLVNPTSYNEKLQWIKLNYKNSMLPKLVDKYTVRKYVEKVCPDILNNLLWVGDFAEEIPWDNLPNKFVIKVTHGSGFNVICMNKNTLNKNETIRKLNKWKKEKFLKCYGEWFYGVEKPKIIIEEFLDDNTGKPPVDYKIFCFDGVPKYIIVDTDRFEKHKRNIYDLEWNFKVGYTMDFPNDKPIDKPKKLDELLKVAEILSKGFPHVRVDLYIVDNKIYFGEMTFTNGAGFDKILPPEFDLELGSYIKLPKK